MRKMKAVLGGVVVVGLVGASAWAGSKTTNWTVGIDTVGKSAYGSVGATRSSADTVQYIGCSVYGFDDGFIQASCGAKNAAGTSVSCSSTVPSIVETVRAMPSDGFVRFQWNDAGDCTYVAFGNYSYYAPKQP
jgi:hypothetical protein